MANLNLSQFGEKLFVADADHTFIWDTAASISKRVSRNSWLNSGTLTSDAPVTISQTWNNAAVAFTGLKVNAVSTASAAGSLLLDLQVGGVSQFTVRKDGAIVLPFGYAGIIDGSVNGGGTNYTWGGPRFGPTAFIAWTASSPAGTADTILLRDGAPNTLALRNGAAAQTFNVYGTWTTAITNFERLAIKYNTTDVAYQIAAEKGTTNGDYRPLQLWTGGASRLHITTAGNVGIGTTSPTSKLHVAETWNAAGTTFAAAKIVVTDTASAAASNLLELWSGSTPALKSYVTKSGSFVGGVVGANQPSALSFPNSGSYSVGIYNPASYKIQFSMSSADPGGVAAGAYTGLQYEMTGGVLSWGTTAQDIVLLRDGEADHLAMRRGALGQKFSVYGTYPGAAWERFTITAPTSGNVLLGTYKGTGGIARGLEIQVDGSTRVTFPTSGNVSFGTAVTFGLDIVGLRDVYCGAGRHFRFTNNSAFTSAGAGIVVFDDLGGANTTPRFQLGGTTNLFPAIKRSSTTLQARLADDSAFAPIQGKLTTETAFTATTVTPTGFITLYDSTGTAYQVPCVPA